jgi:sulfatase maturation enzyme AslB (radical SAM superfamily)
MIEISEMVLARGHSLLILTNAMRPMMRPRMKAGLLDLKSRYGEALTLRVSLDHFTKEEHDRERGDGSFDIAMTGLEWIQSHRFKTHIAGRAIFAESLDDARRGFADLFARKGWSINAQDPSQLVLFPEMDETVDVPEITTSCWGILDIHPDSMMCASSRMVVKRKGEKQATVLACTLLWDDPQFELGESLTDSLRPVSLNHPHCSRFCVLGGASCAA